MAAYSGVTRDEPEGSALGGFPARPHKQWLKELGAPREAGERVMKLPLDRDALSQLLLHRGPILQLDRVTDMEPGTSIRAEKTVRHDEWWCDCHFPGNPVMPGVLIAEALAQAAGVVYASGHPEGGHDMYLAGMDKMRFRRVVRPGDELVLEVRLPAQAPALLVRGPRHSRHRYRCGW